MSTISRRNMLAAAAAGGVLTATSVAKLARCPTACSDAPRARMTSSWARVEPAST